MRGQERLKEAAKLAFRGRGAQGQRAQKPIEGLTIHAVERVEEPWTWCGAADRLRRRNARRTHSPQCAQPPPIRQWRPWFAQYFCPRQWS